MVRALATLASVRYRGRNLLRGMGFELVPIHGAPNLLGLHLHRLFELYGIDLVLDVGAQVGNYAMWLRHNGYKGRIVSFEPVAESFRLLQERSRSDPLWDVRNVALGSRHELTAINVTTSSVFSSFLKPNSFSRSEFGIESAVRTNETVPVERLDDVWPELVGGARRTYLKMDTQGWDLEVLRGAQKCLPDIVAMQSEVSTQPIYDGMPTMIESLSEFVRAGFELSGLFPVTLDHVMRVIEFDCVAVRPLPVADHPSPAGNATTP